MRNIKTVLEVGKYYRSKQGDLFAVLKDTGSGMVYVEFTDGEISLATKTSVQEYEEIDYETFLHDRLLMIRQLNSKFSRNYDGD